MDSTVSTIPNRTERVLIVVDVQNGVVFDAWNRDAVVSNIAEVVSAARAHSTPIVWVQHNEPEMPIGHEYWQLVPELNRLESEPLVHKQFRSSFDETTLETELAKLNASELVIVGAQTNNCIRSTIYSALERGYDVTLVEDAHTTSDEEWDNGPISAEFVVAEQNRTLLNYELPGRSCHLVKADQVFTA